MTVQIEQQPKHLRKAFHKNLMQTALLEQVIPLMAGTPIVVVTVQCMQKGKLLLQQKIVPYMQCGALKPIHFHLI